MSASSGPYHFSASRLRAGAFSLLAIALAGCAADVSVSGDTGRESRSDGRSQSYYLEMRDGVRVALSVYFPGGETPARPAPTILKQTRYGRADEIAGMERFQADGYVIVSVDTRGSTSSFGKRRVDIGPEEVEDMDEIIAHIAAAPWSNGEVIAMGTSYLADTADIAASRPAPALKGAVIREVDFDAFDHLFFPGGAPNDWFLENWGAATREMDEGRSPDPEDGLDCAARVEDCVRLWPILDPVDGDEGFVELRRALAGRDRWAPDDYAGVVFADDRGKNGYTFFSSSPASHLGGIIGEAKPAQIWGSWMDAGSAAAALARYRSAPEVPMEIWITANDHSNSVFADPFFAEEKSPRPGVDRQIEIMSSFMRGSRSGSTVERSINYYVLGADEYRSSKVWPPSDTSGATFYLGEGGSLLTQSGREGADEKAVDFTHNTGRETRWSTQFGTPPAYLDRRAESEKLMTYDTAAFEDAIEIVGTPVVDLMVSTLTDDPAFFVYLEDVAPDGTVTYITEGVLRAIHRRPAAQSDLAYDKGPAAHSFLRKDATPVKPGEVMNVEFALNPVAVRIAQGHRLRLAIGGADACCFRRLSNGASEKFTIMRGGDRPSALHISMRPAAASTRDLGR
ncbi:MAG: CocE/NonD family hydrolase [Parvularculaceae bacterium]|nr:CocE/NonD family hydrolase [Parvularculaceae bacterium]